MTIATELAESAAARSRSYWLLSRWLLAPPDGALLRELDEFFSAAAGGVGADLAPAVAAFASSARELAALPPDTRVAVDFTRLVSGLSPAHGPPPVESAVREGRAQGEAAALAAIAHAEAGFPEPLPRSGPPDHAATGLRFLALCCHAESRAWDSGDAGAAVTWLMREREYLRARLVDWLPGYCEDAARRAGTPLYSNGFRLLAALLPADLDDTKEMLASVDREAALPVPT